MSRVCTCLNFMGTTEESFDFYASVFPTSDADQLVRFGNVPAPAPLGEDDARKVLNVAFPILGASSWAPTESNPRTDCR